MSIEEIQFFMREGASTIHIYPGEENTPKRRSSSEVKAVEGQTKLRTVNYFEDLDVSIKVRDDVGLLLDTMTDGEYKDELAFDHLSNFGMKWFEGG
ncbi:hypothetical protein BGX26_012722 [Mortierella sp. AD094]|nr:hypothetical protein BGX26_012722 [Mortierella sp. AD094]